MEAIEVIKIVVIRQEENGAALFITNVPLRAIQDEILDFDQDLVYKYFEDKFDKEFNYSFCDWFQISGEIKTLL